MWLIVGQLLLKARWRDAFVALREFSQSNKKKDGIQLALNRTFCSIPLPHTHPQSKLPHQLFTISEFKYSILTELGSPVLEPSTNLCKCSQIQHLLPRAASTSNRIETSLHWLSYLHSPPLHIPLINTTKQR